MDKCREYIARKRLNLMFYEGIANRIANLMTDILLETVDEAYAITMIEYPILARSDSLRIAVGMGVLSVIVRLGRVTESIKEIYRAWGVFLDKLPLDDEGKNIMIGWAGEIVIRFLNIYPDKVIDACNVYYNKRGVDGRECEEIATKIAEMKLMWKNAEKEGKVPHREDL